MSEAASLHVRALEPAEAEALLARNHVGRLAFVVGTDIDIEPIHYVVSGDVIVFRTSPGTKETALRHNPFIAFEVDEVDGLFSWRSVVVHGTVYFSEPAGSEHDRRVYADAVRQLQTLIPSALTRQDPVAERNIVLALYPRRITGRAARPSAG